MHRWSCTTVVFSGSSSRAAQLRVSAVSSSRVHEIAVGAVRQTVTAAARWAAPAVSMPMDEARRQKNSPPGLSTRHVPRSIAANSASSRAKCSTALLITTSAKASGKRVRLDRLDAEIVGRQRGRETRRQRLHGLDRGGVRIDGVHVEAAAQQIARGCGRSRIPRRARACPARCGRAAAGRTGRCRCRQTLHAGGLLLSPPEDLEGDRKRHDAPDRENRQLALDSRQAARPRARRRAARPRARSAAAPARTAAAASGKLRRREEHAASNPHRQHGQVHQPGDGLEGLGAARRSRPMRAERPARRAATRRRCASNDPRSGIPSDVTAEQQRNRHFGQQEHAAAPAPAPAGSRCAASGSRPCASAACACAPGRSRSAMPHMLLPMMPIADEAGDQPVDVARPRHRHVLLGARPRIGCGRPRASARRRPPAARARLSARPGRTGRSAGRRARRRCPPRRRAAPAASSPAGTRRGATIFGAATAWRAAPSAAVALAHADRHRRGARDGNATAIATDIRIGKMNAQKSASGSRKNLAQPGQRELDERMVRAAAVDFYSSRRCRPVSDMKTSSSVPWCVITFGAASVGDQRLRRVERDHLAVVHDGRRGRRASRPRPCSAWSAESCRRRRESARGCPRAGGATADPGRSSARRETADPGAPASAQATDRRCFWPPDSLPTRLRRLLSSSTICSSSLTVAAPVVERPEQPQRLLDGQLVGQLRFLELDAEPLAQLVLVRRPPQAEHLHLAGVRPEQAFEDLDRRGLAGAVRAEQAEALAAAHRQRQAVHGHHIAVALHEAFASECDVGHDAPILLDSAPRLGRRASDGPARVL